MKLKGTVKKNTPTKTKGKTKASLYKVNLGKLSNKKTNRLAKQGKLKPKIKKKDRKNKIAAQNEQQQKSESETKAGNVNDDVSDDRDSVSEEEIDPEDTSYFDHLKNAWDFAQTNLSFEERSKTKKRKRGDDDEDEEEKEYEQGARTFASEEDKGDMKMALPIISNGKVIKRMMKKEAAEGGEEDAEMETVEVKPKGDIFNATNENENEKEKESAYIQTLNSAQLFAHREAKLTEKKAKISALSHAILENPQNNISKLKELRLLLGETNLGVSLTVRKYAMVSLMEVFKDIVPGYRMRIPTEKENAFKVKDDTKSLLDYEASFLLNYRLYLEFLETMAKVKPIPDKSFLTKHGIKNLKVPGSSAIELGQLAVKCLCEMLVNHPHFNYRNNLVATVVHFTNHGRPGYSAPACDAVKKVFRTDKKGDVILEIVRAIGRMVKRLSYNVRPQVLLTFLALKIKEVDLSSVSRKVEKMKRAERMKKFSRKERKNMKLKAKLDKELLETKATEDTSQIIRLHTEIIQCVFETYIRVIKLASDSILLGPVLEGLAQFAHLINIEYFDSLFAAFNRLIESGDLTTRETLHCLQTAFTILSGQGSVLNIDPSGFYKHLYAGLMSVHLGTSDETTPIVLECLDVMISKRRKQVSQQRILAFMKRLCSLCLQQTPDTVMAYLAAVRCFLHTYKHTDILVDADVQGSGVYLPLLEDPEHCCANSTSLWELHLLRHHYEPDVRKYSEHLLKGAPLTGPNQLATQMSRTSSKELYKTYNKKEIFHEKIPEKSTRKKKHYDGFADPDFEDYTTQILKSVECYDEDETSSDDDDGDNHMDVDD